MSAASGALGHSDVVVSAVGARSALGFDALQTALGVRAGLFLARRTELRDTQGQAVVMALADPPESVQGFDRLVALGGPALAEAHGDGSAEPAPLLLAAPEPHRPDADERHGTELVGALARAGGVPVDLARSAVLRAGRAAGAQALRLAMDLLGAGGSPRVIVGGVDSYCHPDVVTWLDRTGRLRRAGARDGFVPGEGAAFVVLSRAGAVSDGATPGPSGGDEALAEPGPLAKLCAVETGELPRDIVAAVAPYALSSLGAAEPAPTAPGPARAPAGPTGDASATMTALVERILRAWPGVPVECVLSDVNALRRRAREFNRVDQATLPLLTPHLRPAEALGDVGAASAPMLAAILCAWWRARCAPAKSVLCAVHTDGAERGAFLMRGPA